MATPSISKFKISRVPNTKECIHLYDLLGFDVPKEDQFDTQEDYEEEMRELCHEMTTFILGLAKADSSIQQMLDSNTAKRKSEILNNIQTYLKKKKVIL